MNTDRDHADRRRSDRRRKLAGIRQLVTSATATNASDPAAHHIRAKLAARCRRTCKMIGKGLD